MGGFGDEFVNLTERRVVAPGAAPQSGANLHRFAATAPASYLYIQPGTYRITTEGLPESRHRRPNGLPYHELVIPERHTLWFPRGAVLSLAEGVLLIIRGAIHAEATQIFELPDVGDLRALGVRVWPDPPDPPAELALVRIESTRMHSIRPEWFGAISVDGQSGIAVNAAPIVTRAFQACIHAACRDRTRDGVSLPPLNVICRGIYCVNDTLVALPDESGRGALWLRGNGDASTRGIHIPSLIRYPRGYRPADMPRNHARADGANAALLRVHPAVSLEASGVGLRCYGLENGELFEHDIGQTLLIEEVTAASPRTVGRHVYLDRCGLTGGRLAVITVRPPALANFVPGFFLPTRGRIDPLGVISVPVVPATAGVASGGSGVEVAPNLPAGPSRLLASRSPRYALRDCSLDAVFVPATEIPTPNRSSRFVIDALASSGTFIEVTGGIIVQTYAGPVRSPDLHAGIRVRGGSAFVRSVSFHLGEGPRPSERTAAGEPDGQDLWLDTNAGAIPPHLTVLHADSQSWWFLGGQRVDGTRPGAVCLLNVGAGDVNLTDWIAHQRYPTNLPGDGGQLRRLYTPPSIAWAGEGVPLLIEACMFKRYGTFAGPPTGGFTPDRVVNVGTSFSTPLSMTAATWFPSSVMPGPADALGGLRGGAAAGHPVPTDERARVNVVELPVRTRWM